MEAIAWIIAIIIVFGSIFSFMGDVGNAYSEGGCAGVIGFLIFAIVLVALVYVFGL